MGKREDTQTFLVKKCYVIDAAFCVTTAFIFSGRFFLWVNEGMRA